MSQDWLTFLLQAVLLAITVSTLGGLGPALDAIFYAKPEWALIKRDLAQRLNARILRIRDGEPLRMLTIADSAQLTGKHPDTIRRLIKRLLKEDSQAANHLEQERINGGFRYRISKEYLLEHIPATPVFKIVFDALEGILNRIFGPRVASLRFIVFTATGSILFFWLYLALVILTGMQNATLVQRMFEGRQNILTFCILTGFSLITNVLAIAQTRLFLRFFREHPTGISFLVLAYCDLLLKLTLFIFVFSLGIACSMLVVDATMEKAIPVAISWQQQSPPPSRSRGAVDSSKCNFFVRWEEVNDPSYSNYRLPVEAGVHITSHSHCQIISHIHSEDEFVERYLTGLESIKFQKLDEVRHWPDGCGEESRDNCLLDYTHMVYIHRLLRTTSFIRLWYYGAATAAIAALKDSMFLGMAREFNFIDLNHFYSGMCQWWFGTNTCGLLRGLITETNPQLNPLVPLAPFFVSSLFLSLAIYLSASAFKFLTALGEGLRKFLRTRRLRIVSETFLFTQAQLVILMFLSVLIITIRQILK